MDETFHLRSASLNMSTAEIRVRERIRYFEGRLREIGDPLSPRLKAARTRAANLLDVERRKLAALQAGRPPSDWVHFREAL